MTKILSFVKLDFITVKPYFTLKNLFILIAVSFIMMWSTGENASVIGIIMVFAALYVTYPFAVGEQNGIDALYATLSIKRNAVVLGRYLFAFIMDICAGVIACVLSFVLCALLQKGFDIRETAIVILTMFFVFSILQAFQLPIYFALGYAKAKFAAYLPFLGFPLVILGFSRLLKDSGFMKQLSALPEWIAENPVIAVLFGVVFWLAMMTVSYRLSVSFYKKRDF